MTLSEIEAALCKIEDRLWDGVIDLPQFYSECEAVYDAHSEATTYANFLDY